MSRKSVVARAAVLAVYLFAYFGLVAEWVANLLGFVGIDRLVVNFMFWVPSAIGLWFAMGRARRLGLKEKAGEIYEKAKRHQLKPDQPGAEKPLLLHTQQTSGSSQRVPSPSQYASEAARLKELKDKAEKEAAERAVTEEVEDLGETKIVIRQTIYGKATVYLKNFKVEETVQDSVEIRKGY